jgi:hypothetical protein
MLRNSILKYVFGALCVVVGAWLLAIVWVQTPQFWIPIPESAWQVVVNTFGAHGSDQIALVEFFVYFVLSLVVLVFLLAVIIWRGALGKGQRKMGDGGDQQ